MCSHNLLATVFEDIIKPPDECAGLEIAQFPELPECVFEAQHLRFTSVNHAAKGPTFACKSKMW